MTAAQLAGGFGLPGAAPLPSRIEDSFRRRVEMLPEPTRRLLLVAAADPSGDPVLVQRAAGRLGIAPGAAEPRSRRGCWSSVSACWFRHPLIRSAAYRSASRRDRRGAHRVLAEVTDPRADPDRRAWHRAQAADGPDEEVAAELESSAGRAQGRGGLAAAAAFLERAVLLTPTRCGARNAGWRRRTPACRPGRSPRPGSCWPRWRPGRWTSSRRGRVYLLRGTDGLCRGPWERGPVTAARRQPGGSSCSTATWPGKPTCRRGWQRCSPGAWLARVTCWRSPAPPGNCPPRRGRRAWST